MAGYEYKVVPAPKRGIKAKGAKTTEDRFAQALEQVMNPLGADGWDYLRTDTLPCEERAGLTGRRTEFQNMLVFRRALPDAVATPALAIAAAPQSTVVARAEPVLARPPVKVPDVPVIRTEATEDSPEAPNTSPDDQGPRVAAE